MPRPRTRRPSRRGRCAAQIAARWLLPLPRGPLRSRIGVGPVGPALDERVGALVRGADEEILAAEARLEGQVEGELPAAPQRIGSGDRARGRDRHRRGSRCRGRAGSRGIAAARSGRARRPRPRAARRAAARRSRTASRRRSSANISQTGCRPTDRRRASATGCCPRGTGRRRRPRASPAIQVQSGQNCTMRHARPRARAR